MKPALPTASAACGLNGPSATATVDNATPAGLHLSPWKFCPNKRDRLSPFSRGSLMPALISACLPRLRAAWSASMLERQTCSGGGVASTVIDPKSPRLLPK